MRVSRSGGGSRRGGKGQSGRGGRGEVITDPRLLFSADGPLSKRKPGYSERPEQVYLAAAVEECFDSKSVLLADAPTGTGKSLGYLAPAILRAAQRGEKIVVSTATLALQAQLLNEDLPPLRSATAELLGYPEEESISYAVMKGRRNFLVRRRTECKDTFHRKERFGSNGYMKTMERRKRKPQDLWVNGLPDDESQRGQEHAGKAGSARRRLRHGPARPARYGESWIARNSVPGDVISHPSNTTPSIRGCRHTAVAKEAVGTFRPTSGGERPHSRERTGHLRRARKRLSLRECGMTYGARALRLRSAHSSRGSNDPPRRPGKPVTGRRGTGVIDVSGEGRARDARY